MAPVFAGGKLSFKGDGVKKKKKNNKKKKPSSLKKNEHDKKDEKYESDDGMTDAERRALPIKLERERLELEKVAGKSHRERIETFNDNLGKLTELNDIPRVSAAGNG